MTNLVQDAAAPGVSERGFVTRQFAAVWQYCSDFFARSALRAHFDELDRQVGLDDFLRDVGLCRADLDKIIRNHPRTGRLLAAMMERRHIDPEKLDPSLRYELGRSCALCQEQHRCSHWLAEADPAKAEEFHEFCPNAEVFDSARHAE
jgi:Family of unknown function (DUF6455)